MFHEQHLEQSIGLKSIFELSHRSFPLLASYLNYTAIVFGMQRCNLWKKMTIKVTTFGSWVTS